MRDYTRPQVHPLVVGSFLSANLHTSYCYFDAILFIQTFLCNVCERFSRIFAALNIKMADQNRDTSSAISGNANADSRKDANNSTKKGKKKKSKNRKRHSSSSSSSDSSDSSDSSSAESSSSSDSSSSSGNFIHHDFPTNSHTNTHITLARTHTHQTLNMFVLCVLILYLYYLDGAHMNLKPSVYA